MIAAIKLKVASDAQINQQVGVEIALAPKMCMQMRKVRRDFVQGPEPLRSCLCSCLCLRFVGGAVYNRYIPINIDAPMYKEPMDSIGSRH